MNLLEVEYNFSKISISKSKEQKEFKSNIDKNNIVYLFFKDNECLYIGETGTSLSARCYKHSPKEKDSEWFKQSNKIFIIQFDEKIDIIARQAIEATLILSYRPKYNKKG